MRPLADENLHAGVVDWLRSNGHDGANAAEFLGGELDEDLLRRARDQNRVVVTDERDFGDLMVHRRLTTAGVLLLRQRDPPSPSESRGSPRTGRRSSAASPDISSSSARGASA